MPKGIPYIVANECAERFSFYGMRSILTIYIVTILLPAAGELDVLENEKKGTEIFHWFVMSAYLFPLFGALISDGILGKYRTILFLSLLYCFGHAAIAIDETFFGLYLGLALISMGAGGVKPCVSAHVGDQFGKTNERLIPRVFSWFYFSINLGAALSSFLTPLLLEWYGAKVAFGVPGVLMLIATITFWAGRNVFVHIPPGGAGFIKEAFSGKGLSAILRLSVIYVFIAMFWALFDQTGSTWVLQARHMDLTLNLFGKQIELLPSQLQVVNPVLILVLIPVFSYVVYPQVDKIWKLTPLRKISVGMFLAAIPFVLSAIVQAKIDAGETPSLWWQVVSYVILTSAEILVSITALEFSYTQAPKKMKSWIMALFFASVALGNTFTALVNHFILNEDGTSKLEGPAYYYFFAGTMTATAVLFVVVAIFFKEHSYIQEEEPVEGEPEPQEAPLE